MDLQKEQIRGNADIELDSSRAIGPVASHLPGLDAKSPASSTRKIAVASTFTADLIVAPFKFWMKTLQLSADIVMAPYAQVMQELLNPESTFARNERGINILLIRIEDWIRDRASQESVERNLEHIYRTANDFATAVGTLRAMSSGPIFVFFCPNSSSVGEIYRAAFEKVREKLISRVSAVSNVYCWSHADLVRMYSLTDYEDPRSDKIGHIPYTNAYFVAMATLFSRWVAAIFKNRFKVIAVDCDNTLWGGICGEAGALGVVLTEAHLEFQRHLVRQHDSGLLLCLCSKNNQSDVESVFRDRTDMVLREEHIVSSRVNWSAKSSNLCELSDELGLALDSFVFIDDDPVECAEVRAGCPEVVTLRFPRTSAEVRHFLDHVWAFDRIGITEEAKRRTTQYRENRERQNALKVASDFEQFIASLELKVDVAQAQVSDLERVAELIQRTNQFNLTTIRRAYAEVEALHRSGDSRLLVVRVKDRFGDYGLVGVVIFRRLSLSIDVDTFLLSCRVLGRGVERRVVRELARAAAADGATQIVLRYRQTQRNGPAREFIESAFGQFGTLTKEGDSESVLTVPVEYAASLGVPRTLATMSPEKARSTPISARSTTSHEWVEIAYEFRSLSDLVRKVEKETRREPRRSREYIEPRTPEEDEVARIWADVLGLDKVGAGDNFFDLGGDSLQAVGVLARIESVLGRELSLHKLFEGPTVAEVAESLRTAAPARAPVVHANQRCEAPMSWAQQRLWFIDQLEGGSAAYHIALALRLRGELDRNALQKALDALMERHDALRTIFVDANGGPLQKIVVESHFILQWTDLTPQPIEQREAELERWAGKDLASPFDLSAGPLIRARLLRVSHDDHVLLIVVHHIVSDGWSNRVMIRELADSYDAYRDGRRSSLSPLPIQYTDYVSWQRQWLLGEEQQRQLEYWKKHLREAPELLDLPTDRPRPTVQSFRGANQALTLQLELVAELKDLSRRLNLTLAMTVYAAWAILLSKLSGQETVVVGIPVANRRRPELEGLIGLFVNTLAIHTRVDDRVTAEEFLHQVRGGMISALANQDAPFEMVVEIVNPPRSLSHSPIFQAMFVLDVPPQGATQLSGVTLEQTAVPLRTAQFDLSLALHESADGISGFLNYATDLFDAVTIERWVGSFKSILEILAHDPHRKVSEISLLSRVEHRELVELFNSTRAPYPNGKLMHELFEEQVRRAPGAAAVVYEGRSLTYAELNTKASQLAHYLRERRIGPDQLVGICVERSLEMVVGVLGILKAGGAYLPLDPSYPTERLRYMLVDAAPRALLTQARLREGLPLTAAEVIALDEQWEDIAQQPCEDLDATRLGLRSYHLAYVIYTSGSTGRPKGVMVEHRHVLNLWQGLEIAYRQSAPCQRIALNASLNFDASVQQFVQLLSGRTLCVIPEPYRRDASMLLRFLSESQIHGVDCTPSQLKAWISTGLLQADGSHLHMVLVGGEAIDSELWDSLAKCPGTEFYNVYGPTECTVDSTIARLKGDSTAPHIGHPMQNRHVYVLDRNGRPAAIGVTGEIYIGGDGVARGYLNRPELTAERFITDPFSADPEVRMYKTGDLGCWRADGNIKYLGRNDSQVKIRGFRIELGEVEAQLVSQPEVKEAIVVAREDVPGDKRLVAYVIPSEIPQSRIDADALRVRLRAVLPDYMVPSAFVTLQRFPLSSNGKVDRLALPAPMTEAFTNVGYAEPQGEVEQILAGIWQELLHVERVGRRNNFFALGGHSLLIVQVMDRLRRKGFSVDLRSLYESQTLADLASLLDRGVADKSEAPLGPIPYGTRVITPEMLSLVQLEAKHIEQIVREVPGGAANVQDIYPLAPLQEGILDRKSVV